MYCKKCGAKLHEEANFCMKCGEQVEKILTCSNCGTELPDDAKFCFKCGMKQFGNSNDSMFELVIKSTAEWQEKKYSMDLDSIKSIKVAHGVTECPNFYNLKNLAIVDLPDTIKEITRQGFCLTKLTSIDIPNSVEIIGSHAFEACSELTYVRMSDNIKRISMFAFLGCPKLQYIEYKDQKLSEQKFIDLMKTEGKAVFD